MEGCCPEIPGGATYFCPRLYIPVCTADRHRPLLPPQDAVGRVRQQLLQTRHVQDQLRVFEARDRSVAETNFELVFNWSLMQIVVMLAVGVIQVHTAKRRSSLITIQRHSQVLPVRCHISFLSFLLNLTG